MICGCKIKQLFKKIKRLIDFFSLLSKINILVTKKEHSRKTEYSFIYKEKNFVKDY